MKAKGPTPTKRSTELLQAEGYTVGDTEMVNRGAMKRGVTITHDLFGFADLAAVRADVPGTLYVQVTAGGNGPARRKKILGLRSARTALKAGNRIEIHDWRPYVVQRGTGLKKTKCVREEVLLGDFG